MSRAAPVAKGLALALRLRVVRALLRAERRTLERQIQPGHFDLQLSARIDRVIAALEALG